MMTASANDVTGDVINEPYTVYFEKSPIHRQMTTLSIRNNLYKILVVTQWGNDVSGYVIDV